MSLRTLRGDHCQCASCGEYFNSTYAFDKHRTGAHGVDRTCLTVEGMLLAGMGQNAGGWWISESRPDALCGAGADSVGGDRQKDEERATEGPEDPESEAA